MNLPLLITEEAERDLVEAGNWYALQREGLREEFLAAVEGGFDRIQRMPLIPAVVLQGVRRLLLRRFPYGIYYTVQDDLISVLAVYHTSRDPRGWQRRI